MNLAAGTLVAIVPSSAGLVVAADSRFTFEFNGGRWFCDNVHKITEPNNAKRVAITVTGYSSIWKFNNLPLSEVCTHISQNAAEFDADSVVKSAIEAKPAPATTDVDQLPGICVDAVNRYLDRNPTSYDVRKGLQIFQVAISGYDPVDGVSAVRSFSLDLSANSRVAGSAIKTERFEMAHQPTVSLFGESGFLVDQVLTVQDSNFSMRGTRGLSR